MVIIYRQGKETIVYPVERFDSIKVSVELFGIHADRTYTIIGVREISERKDKKIVLGNYNEKKERDEAFDRFILALINGVRSFNTPILCGHFRIDASVGLLLPVFVSSGSIHPCL